LLALPNCACVHWTTQPTPGMKQPAAQVQVLTVWLLEVAHPQAPVAQEFGKSVALLQQRALLTWPPVAVQSAAGEDASPLGAASWPASTPAHSLGRTQPSKQTLVYDRL